MSAVRVQPFISRAGVEFNIHYDARARRRRRDDGSTYEQFNAIKVVNIATGEEYDGDRLRSGLTELGRDSDGKTVAENAYDDAEQFVLTLYEDGHYILCPSGQYPNKNRGERGQVNGYRRTTVGAALVVRLDDEIVAVTNKTKMIRTSVGNLQVGHRTSFGGLFMNVEADERLISASAVQPQFE